ncbi:hypothetical protein GCM10027578_16880 [Spirosoma luteolum]
MKKVLLIAAFILGFHRLANAQVRYGLTAGVQSSTLRFSGGGLRLSTSGLAGVHLGAVAEYSLNDNLSVRPELLFSMKGGSITDGSDVARLRTSYIELPVQGVYKYEVGLGKLVGGLGPYIGLFIGGNSDGERIESGTDLKAFDAGLRLLGGYELTEQNLSFQLVYNTGLANIAPSSGLVKMTNSTVGLSVSYFFGER